MSMFINGSANTIFNRNIDLNWMGNSPIRSLKSVRVYQDDSHRVWMDWNTWYAKKPFPIVMEDHIFRAWIVFLARHMGLVVEEMPIWKQMGATDEFHFNPEAHALWKKAVLDGLTVKGFWEWLREHRYQRNHG